MTHIDEHIVELIREVIDLEINAKHFYEHAAEVTHHELGKKMFKRLANEESGHLKDVGDIFTSVLGNKDWKEIAEEEIRKDMPSELVENFKKAVHSWGSEEKANDTEALRMAMEMERRAIANFESLADKATTPKGRELALRLVDEEKFHYDILQAQYDSVQNVGIWLDGAEFQMDGKY